MESLDLPIPQSLDPPRMQISAPGKFAGYKELVVYTAKMGPAGFYKV